MIRTGKTVNLVVEEVPSKCTVFAFLCLALAILIFPLISTQLREHMYRSFFFFLGMRELFIDELFNECFHLQENAKKISTDGLFFLNFKCFIRQKK